MADFPSPFYRWRPHPWHGLEVGPDPPEVVSAYIEITPFDSVKYEVDKTTGYLEVDRPQRYSSQPPALYGFIPRTFCGTRVNDLSPKSSRGDHDPLDICVISERTISRSEILINAQIIGGLRMIDHDEADDKIVGVLENDNVYGGARDIGDVPDVLIERLRHYFLTYKSVPEEGRTIPEDKDIEVDDVYGRDHASDVIEASIEDYELQYGGD
ncbi:MAG: inorganic pyrophosphatase [Bradymonadaceae bacterium]